MIFGVYPWENGDFLGLIIRKRLIFRVEPWEKADFSWPKMGIWDWTTQVDAKFNSVGKHH